MSRSGACHFFDNRAFRMVVLVLLGLSLTLWYATSALAFNPYARFFSQCPTGDAAVKLCFAGEVSSGEMRIGGLTVPITKPIYMQDGLAPSEPSGMYQLVAGGSGELLSRTPEVVPGGLWGPTGSGGASGEVTATAEVVANERNRATVYMPNLLRESGPGLTLPVRIHLENAMLGNGCYVGSWADPVELAMTTGWTSPPWPSRPIKGVTGNLGEEAGEVDLLTNDSLVNNEFSVPAADGCGKGEGYSPLIDAIVDVKLGLPSPAGRSAAIFHATMRLADAAEVRAAGAP